MALIPRKGDARRPTSGTTLSTKGSIPTPPNALKEIGSAAPLVLRDVVPSLGTRSASV